MVVVVIMVVVLNHSELFCHVRESQCVSSRRTGRRRRRAECPGG